MKAANVLKACSGQWLTIATVGGVVLGVVVGLILRATTDTPWVERNVMYVNFVGELFLRVLKGLILPLIISSLISAIGSLNLRLSGRIGSRAIAYYMITTVMAVILGIVLVTTIRPGIDRGGDETVNKPPANTTISARHTTTTDTMLDLVRNMFPPNLVQAAMAQYQTVLKPNLTSKLNMGESIAKLKRENNVDKINFSAILFFSVCRWTDVANSFVLVLLFS